MFAVSITSEALLHSTQSFQRHTPAVAPPPCWRESLGSFGRICVDALTGRAARADRARYLNWAWVPGRTSEGAGRLVRRERDVGRGGSIQARARETDGSVQGISTEFDMLNTCWCKCGVCGGRTLLLALAVAAVCVGVSTAHPWSERYTGLQQEQEQDDLVIRIRRRVMEELGLTHSPVKVGYILQTFGRCFSARPRPYALIKPVLLTCVLN